VRLLETPPRYPPYVGGVENVAQALSSRLQSRGDHVLVVCADEPRGANGIGDGVEVRRLRWLGKIANTNITLGLPLVLFREQWDVVHSHIPTPWSSDWSMLIARLRRRGSVVTFYNDIVGSGIAGWIAAVYRSTVLRVTLALASHVVVSSEYWKDELISRNPWLEGRVSVILEGVDLERFQPGPGGDGTRVLFVGVLDRFHRYKGLDVLLEALSTLDETFNLTVVGDGDLRAEYQAQADRLQINDHVLFAGRLDDQMLAETYARSDIYVLPSSSARQESGVTLTALEAMASGAAVILADGAGQLAQDVHEHRAGVRVKAGDAAQLAGALRTLLRDEKERLKLRLAAREYVESRHSWDHVAEIYRALFLDVAKAGGRTPRAANPSGGRMVRGLLPRPSRGAASQ
jgi:glycosyltransferase involved in cell wall biosynthesis